MVLFERALVSSYNPSIHIISVSAIVCPKFYISVLSGAANPKFWRRGGRRGSGMVPFERALVSFYRPSIVSFPLYLRFSEILPFLFSSIPLFPYPTSSLPKISPCSAGSRWIAFWLQRVKVLG